jgi:uncharacterized membrane protein
MNVSTTAGERGNANLIYILYLVALVIGVTSIVGVIMAYLAKDQAPDWLKSHYNNQINIFWKALLYCVIGAVLSIILIGFLILLATLVWYIIRVVQGMQALNRNEPIANPGSWLLA